MQRSGKVKPEDVPLLDGAMEYQAQRTSLAAPMLVLLALVGALVLYAERTQVFAALAGAKAYVHSSWTPNELGVQAAAALDNTRPGATNVKAAASTQHYSAGKSASPQLNAGTLHSDYTRIKTTHTDHSRTPRSGVTGSVSSTARSAAAGGGNTGSTASSSISVLAEVKLADNTTMQIINEPIPDDCHAEQHADYGGDAVRWGLGNKARSAAECCRQCKAFRPGPGGQPCNAWVYCGHPDDKGVCWTMDIHTHMAGDCWLKYQATWDGNTDMTKSNLVVNHRLRFDETFRKEHKTAPEYVPWVAGVITRQT